MDRLLGKKHISSTAPLYIRSLSVVAYIVCIVLNAFNGLLGPETVSGVSDKFRLWVTPPNIFFSIWGLIYTLVTVVLWSAVRGNSWSIRSHLWFWAVNVLNALWIYVWCRGTKEAMVPACIIIAALAICLFCMWRSLVIQLPRMYFITRNTIALYCGWVTGAAMINLGIVLVYVTQSYSQKQFARLFFIATPLLGLAVTAFIALKEGRHGIKSGLGLWVALLWALGGAYISTMQHDKALFSKGLFEL